MHALEFYTGTFFYVTSSSHNLAKIMVSEHVTIVLKGQTFILWLYRQLETIMTIHKLKTHLTDPSRTNIAWSYFWSLKTEIVTPTVQWCVTPKVASLPAGHYLAMQTNRRYMPSTHDSPMGSLENWGKKDGKIRKIWANNFTCYIQVMSQKYSHTFGKTLSLLSQKIA